jgi:hypothetical protein
MAGGWGCPHEVDDKCLKVGGMACDPGMKGCILAGRFVFANDDKNQRLREKKTREGIPSMGDDATGAAK